MRIDGGDGGGGDGGMTRWNTSNIREGTELEGGNLCFFILLTGCGASLPDTLDLMCLSYCSL